MENPNQNETEIENKVETEAEPKVVIESNKSQHVIAGAALLIVLLIILFIMLKPAEQVSAPVTDDVVSENTENTNASTTASTTNSVETGGTVQLGGNGTTQTTNEKGEQVITGEGYTAIIRPVTKVTPIINSFTARESASGSTCFFTWDVDLAQRCNLMTGLGTGVSGVGKEGSVQIKPGTYTLECSGAGGGKAKSEPLTCGV